MDIAIINNQLRLFDLTWNCLREEESDLCDKYKIAIGLACSEWNSRYKSTPFGSVHEPRTWKVDPSKTSLLERNFDLLLNDIKEQRHALVLLYAPVFEAAKIEFSEEQLRYLQPPKNDETENKIA